jgi:hypothetical protein
MIQIHVRGGRQANPGAAGQPRETDEDTEQETEHDGGDRQP